MVDFHGAHSALLVPESARATVSSNLLSGDSIGVVKGGGAFDLLGGWRVGFQID